jgi:hypothetical protein
MRLLSVLGSLLGIGETYLKGKTEIKKAKLTHELAKIESAISIEKARAESSLKLVEIENSETFNMDKMAIKAMDKDWKDDVFALFFFFILFGSFVPQLVPAIYDGLAVLSTLPNFILYGLSLLFVHVFGFRNLLRLFLKKKGIIIDGKQRNTEYVGVHPYRLKDAQDPKLPAEDK